MRIDRSGRLGHALVMIGLVINLEGSGPRIGCVRISDLMPDHANSCGRGLCGKQQDESRAKHGDSSRYAAPKTRPHNSLPKRHANNVYAYSWRGNSPMARLGTKPRFAHQVGSMLCSKA